MSKESIFTLHGYSSVISNDIKLVIPKEILQN